MNTAFKWWLFAGGNHRLGCALALPLRHPLPRTSGNAGRTQRACSNAPSWPWHRVSHLMRLGRTGVHLVPERDSSLLRGARLLSSTASQRPAGDTATAGSSASCGTRPGGCRARQGAGRSGVKTSWQGLPQVMACPAAIKYARAVNHLIDVQADEQTSLYQRKCGRCPDE